MRLVLLAPGSFRVARAPRCLQRSFRSCHKTVLGNAHSAARSPADALPANSLLVEHGYCDEPVSIVYIEVRGCGHRDVSGTPWCLGREHNIVRGVTGVKRQALLIGIIQSSRVRIAVAQWNHNWEPAGNLLGELDEPGQISRQRRCIDGHREITGGHGGSYRSEERRVGKEC